MKPSRIIIGGRIIHKSLVGAKNISPLGVWPGVKQVRVASPSN